MRRHVIPFLAAALLTAACTGDAPVAEPAPPPSPTDPPASSPNEEPVAEQPPPHPVSIRALIERDFDGRGLRVVRALGGNGAYTRSLVTYEGDGLTISGLLVVPRGAGPFPVLVLAHGYIDPAVYTTGRGFERSQDYLARRGFAVLHVDYRNHATSDEDPSNDRELRLGYVEDVVNAVLAVQRSDVPRLDRDRVGLLGRSMGGGVALSVAVVRPDLVDAVVLFAPVSSDAVDNFERWIRRPGRMDLAAAIVEAYGEPDENPAFWEAASPRAHLDRIAVPVMIHHGTADESVPIAWSHETYAAMHTLDKDVIFHTYRGEGHAFGAAYPRSMDRTIRFFRRHLN